MSKPQIALLAAASAAMLLLAAAPAGTTMPTLIRAVHLNGVSGPAYYSVVDGGYRPIRMPAAVAQGEGERLADAADSRQAN